MKTQLLARFFTGTLLAIVGLLLLASQAQAQTRWWINASGGTFVGPSTNWDGGLIPDSTNSVNFLAGSSPERDATYTVTLDQNYSFVGLDNNQGTVGNKVTMNLNSNTLTLTNGALANRVGSMELQNGSGSNPFGILAGYRQMANTTLTFTNVNWTTGSSVSVGEAIAGVNTSNTQLIVQGGSTLTLDSAAGAVIGIGFRSGTGVSNNSKLIVTGAGSAFNFDATTSTVPIRVGNTADSSGNSIEVLNGGSFTLTSAVTDRVLVGVNTDANGNNNTILVSGTDSKMSLGGVIEVGIATNSGSRLTVENNGDFLAAGNLIIRSGSATNNGVLIASGATAAFDGSGNAINGGFLTVDGGTVTANSLALNNGDARVNLLDGSLAINGTLSIGGNNSRFTFDLSNSTPTIATTTFNSSVTNVFLDIQGLVAGGAYTLFTFDSSTGLDPSLKLGNITTGWEDSYLVFNSGSVVLQAIPEPGSAALLGFGLLMMLVRSRRRA